MSRPWQIWTAFALCVGMVLAVMGWISLTVLRLDRAQAEARQLAAQEERIRLALWRMDSALSPIIAQETARPYFVYARAYPVQRAYPQMFTQTGPGEVLVRSPLTFGTPPYVLLHFQFGPDGVLTSPQVDGSESSTAQGDGEIQQATAAVHPEYLKQLGWQMNRDALMASLPSASVPPTARPQLVQAVPHGKGSPQQQAEALDNVREWQARARQQTDVQTAMNQMAAGGPAPSATADVSVGMMQPVWIGDLLLLARRVVVNGNEYVQGCWLDWPGIRRWLLGKVNDLLPTGDLTPANDADSANGARLLAALPVQLICETVPAVAATGLSPIRVSLGIAWGCMLAAAVAVVVLLQGVIGLSERRGAFVSAVTHELRTPLTTFRMYAEMLAENMVPDQQKRQAYLETLRVEADRLGRLVENVLAYARLERGRARARVQRVTLRDVLDQVSGHLASRVEQAGMTLVTEVDASVLSVNVRTDVSAVEQILLNLVDNACKYAGAAEDRMVHLGAVCAGKFVRLWVRDHGPGIGRAESRRLFRPFCKSSRDAAGSAPGVGLGLALSCRLARSMGGELALDKTVRDGACFVLCLPVAR